MGRFLKVDGKAFIDVGNLGQPPADLHPFSSSPIERASHEKMGPRRGIQQGLVTNFNAKLHKGVAMENGVPVVRVMNRMCNSSWRTY